MRSAKYRAAASDPLGGRDKRRIFLSQILDIHRRGKNTCGQRERINPELLEWDYAKGLSLTACG
jgi:hypothetical protein